ncbi:MAG TPA: hypothetical protein DCP71_02880 [Verrucomicrobiales bacterium]|nr:hypothetical protein [Verrucomicrobiales bacterium]
MSTPHLACLEALETRLAPAGLVTITLANGVLTIAGDSGDNIVEITESSPGIWRAQDLSGSGTEFAFNGQPPSSAVSFFIPTGGVKVDLKEGNDNFNLGGLDIAGPLTVTDKAGNDDLGLFETHISGAVKIDLGIGTDTVAISRTSIGGALSLKMGSGDDGVALGSGYYQAVTVDLGTGTNTFGLDAGEPLRIQGNLSVVSAGGALETTGMVLATDNAIIHGHVSLKVLAGSSQVDFGFFVGNHLRIIGNLSLQTAAGNDQVRLTQDLTVGGQLSLKLGEGDNDVSSLGLQSFSLGSLAYTGGKGDDILDLRGTTATIAGSVTTTLGSGGSNVVDINPTTSLFIGGSFTYKGSTGNDLLYISGPRAEIYGPLNFTGLSGVNSLSLVPVLGRFGPINANGGAQTDLFTLGSFSGSTVEITVLGKVNVNHGGGPSSLVVSDVTHHGALIVANAGGTNMYIQDSQMNGPVSLKATGNSNSFFDLSDTTFVGAFSLTTGGGADTVLLDTSTGTSRVNLFRSQSTISLGAGDDLFRAGNTPVAPNQGNAFGGVLTVSGGSGTDTAEVLTGYGNSFDLPAVIKSDVEFQG